MSTQSMNSFAPWHSISIRSVFVKLKTASGGLEEREAQRRRQRFGANIVFRPLAPPPLWAVIATHIVSASPILLITLAAFSWWALHFTLLARAFVVVAVVQVALSVALDERCRCVEEFIRSIGHSVALVKRLRTHRARSETQVRPVDHLVPGDIIVVGGGDSIPADGRVLQSYELAVDESTLTGEPVHQQKSAQTLSPTTPLLDRSNMVYTSSVVTQGRAVVAVTATGPQTVVGTIAKSISSTPRPFGGARNALRSWSIAPIALVAAAGIGGVFWGALRWDWIQTVVLTGFAAVIILCAPYWQRIATTVLQFEAVRRLLRIGIVVKDPGIISRLGDVTMVCFDKTATLTKGSLSVEMALDSNHRRFGSKQLDSVPEWLWNAVVLANDAILVKVPSVRAGERWVGDGTDCALVKSAMDVGYNREKLLARFPRTRSIPFETGRKWMASIHRVGDQSMMIVKGAPERVLSRCSHRWNQAGRSTPMSASHRRQIEQDIIAISQSAKRVIGVASRRWRRTPEIDDGIDNLEWMGLFVLSDPLRNDARLSLELIKQSYCRMAMLTGDHAANATTVARQLGWGVDAIIGERVESIDDSAITAEGGLYHVFARVEPKQKERIIAAFQQRGDIVLMTGDGVNDAYALQTADVGVAVSNATDVARNAARVIVSSDNLLSLATLLSEGRWIRVIQRFMNIVFSFQSALWVAGFITMMIRSGSISLWQVVWQPIVVTTTLMTALLLLPSRPVRFRPRWRALPWTMGLAVMGALLGLGIAIGSSSSATAWIGLSITPVGLVLPHVWKTPSNRRWVLTMGLLAVPTLLLMLVLYDPWTQVLFSVQPPSLSAWAVAGLGVLLTTGVGWIFVRPLTVYVPHS